MAPGPNTKITTMRLPKDLMHLISRRARKNHVSRTQLVERILRDYVNRSDGELHDLITAPPQELREVISLPRKEVADVPVDLFS